MPPKRRLRGRTRPLGRPDATTPARELLSEETIALWQPRCPRPVTGEEARQMIKNVAGVFNLLARWDTEERGQADVVPHPA